MGETKNSKKVRIGVIAAAGKGTRAYPRTNFIPKPLFKIENKSILHRNIELLHYKLKIEKIYILVGQSYIRLPMPGFRQTSFLK